MSNLTNEITDMLKKRYPSKPTYSAHYVSELYDIDPRVARELIAQVGGRKCGSRWVVTEEQVRRIGRMLEE